MFGFTLKAATTISFCSTAYHLQKLGIVEPLNLQHDRCYYINQDNRHFVAIMLSRHIPRPVRGLAGPVTGY